MRVEEIFLSIVSIIQQNMGFILPDGYKRIEKASLVVIVVFTIILKYQTMIQPDELPSSVSVPNSTLKLPNIQMIGAQKAGSTAVSILSL